MSLKELENCVRYDDLGDVPEDVEEMRKYLLEGLAEGHIKNLINHVFKVGYAVAIRRHK